MDIKARIISSCRDLISKKGFRNWTVDQLTADAGVSRRTLYRYFDSKDEIIAAVIDTFLSESAEVIDNILVKENNPADIIKRIIQHIYTKGKFITHPQSLEDLKIYYPYLWDKIDAFRTKQISKVITVFIQSGQNEILKNTDPRIVNTVFIAAIQAVISPAFILENNLPFEETISQLSRFLTAVFLVNYK